MPKFYCDYCDTYLTHDSPSVRKTHCQGRKHKENVRDYYQKWMEEQAQKLVRTSRCRPSTARLTCSLRLDRSHHSGLQIRKTTQRTVRHARCSPDGPAHGPTTAGYASDDATLGLPHATGHETTRTTAQRCCNDRVHGSPTSHGHVSTWRPATHRTSTHVDVH